FFFSSRRRHTRWPRDWSSDVCSSDLHLQEHSVGSSQAFLEDGELFGLEAQLGEVQLQGALVEHTKHDLLAEDRRHGAHAKVDLRSEERRVGKECRSRWVRE